MGNMGQILAPVDPMCVKPKFQQDSVLTSNPAAQQLGFSSCPAQPKLLDPKHSAHMQKNKNKIKIKK
jgi:hypothetical protein